MMPAAPQSQFKCVCRGNFLMENYSIPNWSRELRLEIWSNSVILKKKNINLNICFSGSRNGFISQWCLRLPNPSSNVSAVAIFWWKTIPFQIDQGNSSTKFDRTMWWPGSNGLSNWTNQRNYYGRITYYPKSETHVDGPSSSVESKNKQAKIPAKEEKQKQGIFLKYLLFKTI